MFVALVLEIVSSRIPFSPSCLFHRWGGSSSLYLFVAACVFCCVISVMFSWDHVARWEYFVSSEFEGEFADAWR